MQPIAKDKCDLQPLRQRRWFYVDRTAWLHRLATKPEGHCALSIVYSALFIAVLTVFASGAAAEVVTLPEEQRGRDFTMEFDARFAHGAPRNLVLRLGSAGRPGVQPDKLSFSKTSIDFAGNWTRTLDFIGSGYTGTPFMERQRYREEESYEEELRREENARDWAIFIGEDPDK